jgi:hypothetical protein
MVLDSKLLDFNFEVSVGTHQIFSENRWKNPSALQNQG